MRELKLVSHHREWLHEGRTLPRVRELKPAEELGQINDYRRTLPRVRELKRACPPFW